MAAPLLEINPIHPNPRTLDRAVEVLRGDGVIAYPTDSCYGLGCDLSSRRGLKRLQELKGRERTKPFSFVCSDLSHLSDYAKVSNFAYRILRALTPGAFTFILPATKKVPELLQTKRSEVGIRVPDAVIPRELVRRLGSPLVSTSAQDRDGRILEDAREIKEVLGKSLDLILDGGQKQLELSTVVSLLNDEVEIVRQGKGVLTL